MQPRVHFRLRILEEVANIRFFDNLNIRKLALLFMLLSMLQYLINVPFVAEIVVGVKKIDLIVILYY